MGEKMVSEWRWGSWKGYFNFSEHGVGEMWRNMILWENGVRESEPEEGPCNAWWMWGWDTQLSGRVKGCVWIYSATLGLLPFVKEVGGLGSLTEWRMFDIGAEQTRRGIRGMPAGCWAAWRPLVEAGSQDLMIPNLVESDQVFPGLTMGQNSWGCGKGDWLVKK